MEKRSRFFFLYGVFSAIIIPVLRWILNYDRSWGIVANRIFLITGIVSMLIAVFLVLKAGKKK